MSCNHWPYFSLGILSVAAFCCAIGFVYLAATGIRDWWQSGQFYRCKGKR